MTPTTVTRSITITPASPDSATELAAQPLKFTTDDQCKNKNVMAAVIDALTDKSRSDECIAAIFKNAYLHHYQTELNRIIINIETRNGTGMVVVNSNVVRILAQDRIDLVQNNDGTVQLEKVVVLDTDRARHDEINLTLDAILPTTVCELIGTYGDEIEVHDRNRNEIIAILKSRDPLAKGMLIAAASHQRKIQFLNDIFKAQFGGDKRLHLAGVDLSNLDLTGINLNHANLSYANLQNCCLRNARLRHAWMQYVNLNRADLSHANLVNVRLYSARLIGANLFKAKLTAAAMDFACLFCANFEGVNFGYGSTWQSTIYNFSNFKTPPETKHGLDYFVRKTLQPVDVIIVDNLPVPSGTLTADSAPASIADQVPAAKRPTTVVINKKEKMLLLNRGILMEENSDGSVRLSAGLTMRNDPFRKMIIDATLKTVLPEVLTDLISAYDDDIEVSARNEDVIIMILKSGKQVEKARIVAAASHQQQIAYMNSLFLKLREKNVKLDFPHIDLSDLDLTGINLDFVNLGQAVMHGCNLYQATLKHTFMVHANLNGASLEQTDFSNADMTGAKLFQANLKRATLINVTLVGAVLKYANLENADLHGFTELANAHLDHAILKNANLAGTDMVNVSLTHADLTGVNLNEADLTNAKLMHANLHCASLVAVNLSNADLSHANFQRVTLVSDPVLTGAVWNGVHARRILSDANTRKMLPWRIRLHCI